MYIIRSKVLRVWWRDYAWATENNSFGEKDEECPRLPYRITRHLNCWPESRNGTTIIPRLKYMPPTIRRDQASDVYGWRTSPQAIFQFHFLHRRRHGDRKQWSVELTLRPVAESAVITKYGKQSNSVGGQMAAIWSDGLSSTVALGEKCAASAN